VDNEFGRDMVLGPSKETPPKRNKMNQSGNFPSLSAFVTGTGPTRDDQNENARGSKFADAPAPCQVCTKQHDIWKCSKFKGLTYEEKRKTVQSGGLCNKCLVKGHIAKECPKVNFKCQRPGCGGSHHTLMHRLAAGIRRDLNSMNRNTASQNSNSATAAIAEQHLQPSQATARSCDVTGAGDGNGIAVAATGVGETRVCLGSIPVKVRGKSNEVIKTYALLDNGSEVTVCHEQLANKLELDGETLNFTLTGMTGSTQMESRVVDLTVMSMDESVVVELRSECKDSYADAYLSKLYSKERRSCLLASPTRH